MRSLLCWKSPARRRLQFFPQRTAHNHLVGIIATDGDGAQGPFSWIVIGHAVRGASISMLGFPFVVVGLDIGTGALECEEAGRPF